MLHKIQEFIKERSLKPSDCKYHTLRDLDNGGKARVLVLNNEDIARVEYVCPYCGHYGYYETKWKRPFSFKCEKCGKSTPLPRLKDKK